MAINITAMLTPTLFDTPISSQAVFSLPLGTALLLFTVLLLLLVVALIWNTKAYQVPQSILAHAHSPEQQTDPTLGDDLTVIEGIDPNTAAAFQTAGLHTYQDLADADVEKLKTISAEADFDLTEPSSWIKQAQLAADGDWQGLQRLQDELTASQQAADDVS